MEIYIYMDALRALVLTCLSGPHKYKTTICTYVQKLVGTSISLNSIPRFVHRPILFYSYKYVGWIPSMSLYIRVILPIHRSQWKLLSRYVTIYYPALLRGVPLWNISATYGEHFLFPDVPYTHTSGYVYLLVGTCFCSKRQTIKFLLPWSNRQTDRQTDMEADIESDCMAAFEL